MQASDGSDHSERQRVRHRASGLGSVPSLLWRRRRLLLKSTDEGIEQRRRHLPNVNSAYRVHEVLSRASRLKLSRPAVLVWGKVFGTNNEFETVRLLGLLHEEAGLAKSQMKASNPSLSEDLYIQGFANVEESIRVARLGEDWENFRRFLLPDVLRQLKTCAELTPRQEESVDADDLEQLASDLWEFELAVKEGSLPDDVKAFIMGQISIIKRAILEYQIVGIRAFNTALGVSLVELSANSDLIEEHQDEPEVRQLGTLWGRVFGIVERFNSLANAVDAGRKLLELGGNISDKLP